MSREPKLLSEERLAEIRQHLTKDNADIYQMFDHAIIADLLGHIDALTAERDRYDAYINSMESDNPALIAANRRAEQAEASLDEAKRYILQLDDESREAESQVDKFQHLYTSELEVAADAQAEVLRLKAQLRSDQDELSEAFTHAIEQNKTIIELRAQLADLKRQHELDVFVKISHEDYTNYKSLEAQLAEAMELLTQIFKGEPMVVNESFSKGFCEHCGRYTWKGEEHGPDCIVRRVKVFLEQPSAAYERWKTMETALRMARARDQVFHPLDSCDCELCVTIEAALRPPQEEAK